MIYLKIYQREVEDQFPWGLHPAGPKKISVTNILKLFLASMVQNKSVKL